MKTTTTAPKTSSSTKSVKQLVLALTDRKQGVTVKELMKKFGWKSIHNAHSTLSSIGREYNVTKDTNKAGEKVYRTA